MLPHDPPHAGKGRLPTSGATAAPPSHRQSRQRDRPGGPLTSAAPASLLQPLRPSQDSEPTEPPHLSDRYRQLFFSPQDYKEFSAATHSAPDEALAALLWERPPDDEEGGAAGSAMSSSQDGGRDRPSRSKLQEQAAPVRSEPARAAGRLAGRAGSTRGGSGGGALRGSRAPSQDEGRAEQFGGPSGPTHQQAPRHLEAASAPVVVRIPTASPGAGSYSALYLQQRMQERSGGVGVPLAPQSPGPATAATAPTAPTASGSSPAATQTDATFVDAAERPPDAIAAASAAAPPSVRPSASSSPSAAIAPSPAQPGVFDPEDLQRLAERLSGLGRSGVDAIKGYVDGYIDARCSDEDALASVRS